MLDGLRIAIADRLAILAERVAADPRYPFTWRVSHNARTVAGVVITPDTAMTVAAVWACIRYLSQTVAVLPWHVMRGDRGGAEVLKSHPVDYLLYKRSNAEWSSYQFRETLTHWALRWGNGYAEIELDQAGRPFALWPIHPERVQVRRAVQDMPSSSGDEIAAGELYYEVSNNGTEAVGGVTLPARRMFHIRGFGEGPVGVNVIAYAAESIGWARAIQLFGAAFFGNSATPTVVVMNKKPLTREGVKKQRQEFESLFKGPRNSHRTAHTDNDAEIKTLGIDASKSQLVESYQLQIEEICRWFGVPPHKVQHLTRATFNNIEHQAIEVVVDAVSPWVKRFEDEAEHKLLGQNRGNLYTKMNMRALLRGDTVARTAWYRAMWSMGVYCANDILALEDENTIGKKGDAHFVQSGFVTLDKAIAGDTGASAPPVEPDTQQPDQEVVAMGAIEALNEAVPA